MSFTGTKTEISASNFEVDSDDLRQESKIRIYRLVESARIGLTALALAAGVTVLGVAANSVSIYNATNVTDAYLLPLWPVNMDLRPTVVFIVTSTIIILTKIISLVASRAQPVSSKHLTTEQSFLQRWTNLRLQKAQNRAIIHMALSIVVPAVAFIAALVGVVFFYTVNASATVDSFQSWTCRWQDVPMITQPHFGTLCKQSQAGLGLAVFLLPLEAIILGMASYQALLQRQLSKATRAPEPKTGPPSDMS
ncbi:hypothetical protein BGZ63DRAFT_262702 [Mariannaea sp. PMI_226]|nr:hypothetical protein BGZ63DRAFT_262702 [Mariannaea sp. PMI_226]